MSLSLLLVVSVQCRPRRFPPPCSAPLPLPLPLPHLNPVSFGEHVVGDLEDEVEPVEVEDQEENEQPLELLGVDAADIVLLLFARHDVINRPDDMQREVVEAVKCPRHNEADIRDGRE